jgi:hypothetical protein
MKLRKAKEVSEKIKSILLYDWDPIGVSDVPEAQDEYDSYVGGVLKLLTSDASEHQLVKHLHQLETVAMGLPSDAGADHLKTAARKLMQLKNEQL